MCWLRLSSVTLTKTFLNQWSDVHGSKSSKVRKRGASGGFGYQKGKHQFKTKIYKPVSGKQNREKRQFSRWQRLGFLMLNYYQWLDHISWRKRICTKNFILGGWAGWWCWVASSARASCCILHIVGQGPAVLAAGEGQVGYIFFYTFHLSSLSNVLSFGRRLNMTEILLFNANGSCQLLPRTSSIRTG